MPILQPVAAYSFRDRWHVDAPPARVREVLVDVEHYVEWWPEVVAVAVAGEGRGLVLCRSVLPYTLELLLTEEVDRPERLEVSVEGDLEGRVSFDLAPEGPGTRLDFAQDVRVRGLLAVASLPALEPRPDDAVVRGGAQAARRQRGRSRPSSSNSAWLSPKATLTSATTRSVSSGEVPRASSRAR